MPAIRHTAPLLLLAGLALAGCPFEDKYAEGAGPPDVTASPETSGAADVADTAGPSADEIVDVAAPAVWVADLDRNPRGIHLSWQGDPATTITASWATNDIDAGSYEPKLWIVPTSEVDTRGAMPYADAWVKSGTSITYKESLLGVETGTETFIVHHAEAKGLQPNTSYTYRVGSWDGFDPATGTFTGPNLSEPRTFTTGLPKGSREAFDFVLAGDSRGGYPDIELNMPRFVSDTPARMWFFNGDMNNAGTQEEWDSWFNVMEPLISERVLMPVQGNHEVFANLYYNQFELPKEPDIDEDLREHAWSVDYANIHFVGTDSNTEQQVEDQVAWLRADLKAASEDPDIDWIIVMMHHPAYSACTNHGSTQRVQDHWVPEFEEYGVDLVFAGHDHNYERTHPLRNSQVVDEGDGPIYVVAGAFFARGYTNGSDWWTAVSHHGDKANYVTVRAEGNKLDLTAWSGDGLEVLDTFSLTK